MSLTAQHRQMAVRIDARMKQLEALNLEDIEILSAMSEYMSDFHHLISNTGGSGMATLCEMFPGFYRFAKMLETLASGIAAGKIKVPGGHPNPNDKENQLAAAIDLRVRQLEAKGISDAALMEQMVGYAFDLHHIWSTASDEYLLLLCREYPGLYRYGRLMEEEFEAESKKLATAYSDLPLLPDAIKTIVAQLLTNGATLERELQAILNKRGSYDVWKARDEMKILYQQWTTQFSGLTGELRTASVPYKAYAMLMRIFEPMAQRINHLYNQVFAKRN